MAYIRVSTELPSGISGWYIYYDVNGKMFISSPEWSNCFHSLEDVIVIRNILNQCIADMKKEEKKKEIIEKVECPYCRANFEVGSK